MKDGDVGRPDLSLNHTPQQLAEILYDSLHTKLMTLPDDAEIYPAHGAGSLCGRQMSAESSSTIGRQKQTNYALLTDQMPSRPEYFARDVDLNRRGQCRCRNCRNCRHSVRIRFWTCRSRARWWCISR